jgi:hypothetical protein
MGKANKGGQKNRQQREREEVERMMELGATLRAARSGEPLSGEQAEALIWYYEERMTTAVQLIEDAKRRAGDAERAARDSARLAQWHQRKATLMEHALEQARDESRRAVATVVDQYAAQFGVWHDQPRRQALLKHPAVRAVLS